MEQQKDLEAFSTILRGKKELNSSELRHCGMLKGLILHFSALVSDYPMTEQEAEWRAESWANVIKPAIFDKHLSYTVRAILASRDRKGPVHADEFLQVWIRVKSGEVWSTRKREWTTLIDQICSIYESSPVYELMRRDFPEPSEPIQEQIKAQIYGWEE